MNNHPKVEKAVVETLQELASMPTAEFRKLMEQAIEDPYFNNPNYEDTRVFDTVSMLRES